MTAATTTTCSTIISSITTTARLWCTIPPGSRSVLDCCCCGCCCCQACHRCHDAVKAPIVSSHSPQENNSKPEDWLIAKANIRPGTVPARIPVLELIARALQVSFYARNVTQSIRSRQQWPKCGILNRLFSHGTKLGDWDTIW